MRCASRSERVSLLACCGFLLLALSIRSDAATQPLGAVVQQARDLIANAAAVQADSLLMPHLSRPPFEFGRGDSLQVEGEAAWLEARMLDQLPVDTTFHVRARAVLNWRIRHTPLDRERRVSSMTVVARSLASADSALSGEAMIEDALRLCRQHPPLPPATQVRLLHLQGQLAIGRGDFPAAIGRLQEARGLARSAFGDSDAQGLRVASDLALARRRSGALIEARADYESLLAITRKAPEGVGRLRGSLQWLTGLAAVMRDLNDPAGERRYLEEVLHLADGQLRPDDPFVLASWHRYAINLRGFGLYDTALVIASQVAEQRLKLLGREDPDFASTLGLQANLLCDLGRFDEAEPLSREAYGIYRSLRGADQPDVLTRLQALGNLARARGNYAEAESLFSEVVAGRRARLGRTHGGVAEALYNLALAREWRGDTRGAIAAGLEAADIRHRLWSTIIPFLEERSALQLVDEYWVGHDVAIDALIRTDNPDSAAVSDTWSRVTSLRSLVLDEVAKRRSEVATRPANGDSLAWDQWNAARRQLAGIALAGFDLRRDPGATSRRDSLQWLADSLERVVGAESAALRSHRFDREANDAELRARLPQNAVLVGFVRYPRIKQAEPLDRWYKDLDDRYAAFIRVGRNTTNHLVDIGSAATVDSLVDGWAMALQASSPRAPSGMAEYLRRGRGLRKAIWDPLLPFLGGANRVLIVADGALHRVAWETLPLADDRFVIDEGPRVTRLFSERDLAKFAPLDAGLGLLACGGIAYDAVDRAPNRPSALIASRGRRPSCRQFASLKFPPLPAASDEVEDVTRLWRQKRPSQAVLLGGASATVWRFAETAPGRSFIHLATHGFYIEDSCAAVGPERDSFKRDPLLRCGLVMAGANRRATAEPDGDDGLLLAAEVAQLDLHECECVLLSACESGLGEFSRTQGVFGLQRAFRIAGARAVVASSWPVDDEAARAWMASFYRARLRPTGTTADASWDASRSLLRSLRARGLAPAPRVWASFSAAGDPR